MTKIKQNAFVLYNVKKYVSCEEYCNFIIILIFFLAFQLIIIGQ